MSVRNLFRNILNRSSITSARGANRRSSDFQPLTTNCDPDLLQHFNDSGNVGNVGGNAFRENNGGGGPFGSHSQDPVQLMQQPPMEMKSFKKRKPTESSHLHEVGESTDLIPPPTQVYNPTSEALPEELQDPGPGLLDFPNVRLAIEEVFGGDNGNNDGDNRQIGDNDDDNGIDFSGGRRKYEVGRVESCLTSACTSRSGKQHAKMMCAIIVGLACVFAILLALRLSGSSHNQANDPYMEESMKVLRRQKWPLHDVISKKQNISFDTMARAHLLWNFDKDESKEEEKQDKEKERKSKSTGLYNHSGSTQIPTVNGVVINESILSESYKTAREILAGGLNENSSMLEALSWKGLAGAVAINELMAKTSHSTQEESISIEGVLPNDLCDESHTNDQDLKCNHSIKYRSLNGECNNVINTLWGSQYSPLRRIIDTDMSSTFKHHLILSFFWNESTLLSPASVSRKVHGGTVKSDPNASALLPFWGMFILHDTVKVADSPVSCCDYQANHFKHPLLYKGHDKDFTSTCSQKSVLPYTHGTLSSHVNGAMEEHPCESVMSFPAMYPSCKLGEPRSSFNLATSYIDASNLYGSSESLSKKLRSGKDGKLKVKVGKHSTDKGFLLNATGENETCFHGPPINANIPNCFLSGDPNVNQVALLTTLNTIWMRQHNNIAHWLRHHNEHWDDDRLFLETRRIVIAQIQHITYNEFLPQLLGTEIMEMKGVDLTLKRSDYYRLYDPAVDPTVSNAFAGAVGYFWLSMVNGQAKSIWETAKSTQDTEYSVNKLFYMPRYVAVHKRNLEALLNGFMASSSNQVGMGISSQLRSLHVHAVNSTLDMVKMVIQRGRDLEIAPYMEWRRLCGFPEIISLRMLKDHWEPEAFETISQVYKYVQQIDLFTGMLAEKPLPSGRVGPTLACLLTDQFLRFKKGDRFWYEGNVYADHFSNAQLKEIRKSTLAKVICDNTDDDFQEIQRWPLLTPTPDSDSNPVLLCVHDARIPILNFRVWKERLTTTTHKPDGESKEPLIDEDDNWYGSSEESEEIHHHDPHDLYSEESNRTTQRRPWEGAADPPKNGTSHTDINPSASSLGTGTENVTLTSPPPTTPAIIDAHNHNPQQHHPSSEQPHTAATMKQAKVHPGENETVDKN